MHCGLYNPQCKNLKKRIAGSTTCNVKNFETHCGLYNPQFIFEIFLNCGLYNPQCVSKFFTLQVVEPAMCFKIFTPWVIDEGHFGLFIMSKIGILKNYGGAGSRHGGAGRITLPSFCLKKPKRDPFLNFSIRNPKSFSVLSSLSL